jgi:uncharacterized membrane protein (DUF106 family)
MSILNSILRGLFDALLLPFRELHPLVGLTVLSAALGVAMLLIFKATSNQAKIEAVKRRIHAGVFEIRLFNDDLGAIFRAQGEVLRHNLRYMGLSLVPLLWMIVPVVLVIAQLQFHYGFRGLTPGEPALLKVALDEGWRETHPAITGNSADRPQVELDVPEGLRVTTPAVWLPSLGEITWRVQAEEPGDYEIGVRLGGESYGKALNATGNVRRRAPSRLKPGFFNQLLYPAEDPLPGSGPVRSISVAYPGATVWFFGLRLHWLIIFFVLSIVFAFTLKDRLGVKI